MFMLILTLAAAEVSCPDGPFRASITVAFQRGDEIAEATFDFPPGKVPSAADYAQAMDLCEARVVESAPGFKRLSRHEFVKYCLGLPEGFDVAVPGPDLFTLDKTDGAA